MKHLKAKETYNTNPYIHKHVDLWVEDDEIVSPINKGTEGQVITKGPNGEDMWGNPAGGGVTPITHAELKALRNEGKLVAGQQYRITDYHCTTAQENTQSADHQFDIIVTADDENTLNENARAVQREGSEVVYKVENLGVDAAFARYVEGDMTYEDTQYYAFDATLDEETHLVLYATSENPNNGDDVYGDIEGSGEISILPTTWIKTSNDYFASSNLAAWELKYSIDNDKQRFAWAKPFGYDATLVCFAYGGDSGGYLMKTSEFTEDGNEIWVVVNPSREPSDREDWASPDIMWIKSVDPDYADRRYAEYEEGTDDIRFYSMDRGEEVWGCFNEEYHPIMCAPQVAGSGVIYYMKDEWNNECPYDFKNIQFKRKLTDGVYDPDGGVDTWVYTFNWQNEDMSCEDTSVEQFKHPNDDEGYSNTSNNKILEYRDSLNGSYGPVRLNDIVFLSYYGYGNGIFYGYSGNTFGSNCFSNTFGSNCSGNTFKSDCDSNTFGDDCYSNTFGDNCFSNTFKSGCERKHLEFTSDKTFNDSFPEFWFYNTKKW